MWYICVLTKVLAKSSHPPTIHSQALAMLGGRVTEGCLIRFSSFGYLKITFIPNFPTSKYSRNGFSFPSKKTTLKKIYGPLKSALKPSSSLNSPHFSPKMPWILQGLEVGSSPSKAQLAVGTLGDQLPATPRIFSRPFPGGGGRMCWKRDELCGCFVFMTPPTWGGLGGWFCFWFLMLKFILFYEVWTVLCWGRPVVANGDDTWNLTSSNPVHSQSEAHMMSTFA